MEMVTITIDGQTVQAPKTATVLEAARSAGVAVPNALLPSGAQTGRRLPGLYGRSRRSAYACCLLRLSC